MKGMDQLETVKAFAKNCRVTLKKNGIMHHKSITVLVPYLYLHNSLIYRRKYFTLVIPDFGL